MKKLILFLLMLCLPLQVTAEGVAAWLPYWEASAALEDAECLAENLDSVIVFAAVFDQKGKPVLPDGAESLLLRTRHAFAGTNTKVYISIVNDQEKARGGYQSKTAELIARLLWNDRAMDQHLDDLLLLLDKSEADGLELDYENFGSDTKLYARYARLIEKLYAALSADGMGLRVVLNWDAPRYMTLPEGPEYSVMCYNLYGYHSGPGPKADTAFLKQVADLWRDVPGTVRMAFAAGGFLWKGSKVVSALTQQEAEKLLTERGVVPTRDAGSGALTATFIHEGGKGTLWYADGETLKRWQTQMNEFDGTDLFCLGGADPKDWLRTVFQDNAAAEEEKSK